VASLRANSEQDMLGRAPWASTRPGAVEVVRVPVSTLDAHLPPPRAALLLKIDAQGHGSCVANKTRPNSGRPLGLQAADWPRMAGDGRSLRAGPGLAWA